MGGRALVTLPPAFAILRRRSRSAFELAAEIARMAAHTSSLPAGAARERFIVERWQAYEAESRANLLRIIAIGAFYLVHLWSYLSSQGKVPNFGFFQLAEAGEIGRQFHIEITLLTLAWAMLALGILVALQQRIFPVWLPYCSTACDIILLTSMLCISSGHAKPARRGLLLDSSDGHAAIELTAHPVRNGRLRAGVPGRSRIYQVVRPFPKGCDRHNWCRAITR